MFGIEDIFEIWLISVDTCISVICVFSSVEENIFIILLCFLNVTFSEVGHTSGFCFMEQTRIYYCIVYSLYLQKYNTVYVLKWPSLWLYEALFKKFLKIWPIFIHHFPAWPHIMKEIIHSMLFCCLIWQYLYCGTRWPKLLDRHTASIFIFHDIAITFD